MRRLAMFAAIVGTVGLIAVPAQPVSADTGLAGGGVSADITIGGVLVAQGTYTGQLLPNGRELLVEFECSAEFIGAAASTSIKRCVLNAGDGQHFAPRISLPGNAAATGSVATVPLGGVRLCWIASAQPILGGERKTSDCTQLNL